MSGMGFEMVLGLELGTGLALGLRVGWVLYVTARIYTRIKALQENHSKFPSI